MSQYKYALNNYLKSLEFYKRVEYKKGISKSYIDLANLMIVMEKYSDVKFYFNKALKIDKEINYLEGLADDYLNIGRYYLKIDLYKESLKFFQRALRLFKRMNHYQSVIFALEGVKQNCDKMGRFEISFFCAKNIKDCHIILNQYSYLPFDYIKIGSCLKKIGKKNLAAKYYYKALSISNELKKKKGIFDSYLNLGSLYQQIINYKEALRHYKKAYTICKKIRDNDKIAEFFRNFGKILFIKNKNIVSMNCYKKSLFYLRKSLRNDKKIKDKFYIAWDHYNIGKVYEELKKYNMAKKYYNKSSKLFNDLGLTHLSELSLKSIELMNEILKFIHKINETSKKDIHKEIINLLRSKY